MANEENLIPHQYKSDQSREEAAKNGKKGGKASGAARRAKRDAKDVANLVLSLTPNLPQAAIETMHRMGMKKNARPDMRYIASLAIMQKAMKGDRGAYGFLLDLAGETAQGEIEQVKVIEARRRAGLEESEEREVHEENISDIRRKMDEMTDDQLAQYEALCDMFRDGEG